MAAPTRGLYEVLMTEALEQQLMQLGATLSAKRGGLRPAEAADRIALHLARVVERSIASIDESERTAIGIDLARRLIDIIRALPSANNLATERPLESGQILH